MSTLTCQLRRRARIAVAGLALLALPLAGCSTPTGPAAYGEANDPLEGLNRGVYGFNEGVDILAVRPAAEVYRGVLPDPVREAVRNFLRNLSSPLLIANALLQGDTKSASDATGRFLTNTAFGLGGLIDVAATTGVQYKPEDFGKTLAVWGVPEGPYLVLPLLGPSTLRDAVGMAVDAVADPLDRWAGNTHRNWISYGRFGVGGIDTRSRVIEALDDIRRNSLDPYAAMRSLYRQHRAAEVNNGQAPATEFPDFEDTSPPATSQNPIDKAAPATKSK